jgi:hypothetical protein
LDVLSAEGSKMVFDEMGIIDVKIAKAKNGSPTAHVSEANQFCEAQQNQ